MFCVLSVFVTAFCVSLARRPIKKMIVGKLSQQGGKKIGMVRIGAAGKEAGVLYSLVN